MRLLIALLVWLLRAVLKSRGSLALKNVALRQQLATYARRQKRSRLKPEERAFWGALSRVWQSWRSPLLMVKPATVIAWHRRGSSGTGAGVPASLAALVLQTSTSASSAA
jgi:hypothetical protein